MLFALSQVKWEGEGEKREEEEEEKNVHDMNNVDDGKLDDSFDDAKL